VRAGDQDSMQELVKRNLNRANHDNAAYA
jgi:hypothetical protein